MRFEGWGWEGRGARGAAGVFGPGVAEGIGCLGLV